MLQFTLDFTECLHVSQGVSSCHFPDNFPSTSPPVSPASGSNPTSTMTHSLRFASCASASPGGWPPGISPKDCKIPGQDTATTADAGGSDPLAAIQAVNALATPDSSALLVLVNFHRFLGSPEIVQALARQISQGKHNRAFVIILSPIVDIPTELEKLFVVVDHELPGREQLAEIARGIATEEAELPSGDDLTMVLDAAAGLTRFEAEGAFSLSLVRDGQLQPRSIWELKSQMLKKSGLLSLYHGRESFDDLGGLDNLKSFCTRAMRRQRDNNPLKRPRGVMLLSPPGCGKSQFAKTLGNETGRPTLILGCRCTDGQPRRPDRVQHSAGPANR